MRVRLWVGARRVSRCERVEKFAVVICCNEGGVTQCSNCYQKGRGDLAGTYIV